MRVTKDRTHRRARRRDGLSARRHRLSSGDEVMIDLGGTVLGATMVVPDDARAVVVLAYAVHQRRLAHRSRRLASALHDQRLATVAVDLLSEIDRPIVDVTLLASRLAGVTAWLRTWPAVWGLPIAYLAADASAAALVAAASRDDILGVVCCGGRPDLATAALPRLQAPTLLLVATMDALAVARNRRALAAILAPAWIEHVPGVTQLLEDAAGLDDVARRTAAWIDRCADRRRRVRRARARDGTDSWAAMS